MTLAPDRPGRFGLRDRIGRRPADGATPAAMFGAVRPVILFRDVEMAYPGGKIALRDVDLTIREGEFVFIVGPSGAGKSTLLRLLIRDEVATPGQVLVDGVDLAHLRRREVPRVRRRIGTIFQDFKLLPSRPVWENVSFALVHDPRLIIADEPTGNLDPLISWEIIQLLLRINELGVTVLMATHDAEVVTALRRRVVALEDGRVVRDELGAAYHRED